MPVLQYTVVLNDHHVMFIAPTHQVILVSHYSCSEERIRNGEKKLQKSKQGTTRERLDSFFKAIPSPIADKRKVLTCVCVSMFTV